MAEALDRSSHYLIHERLGLGGMGEVYLGTMASPAGRRPVAVKQVSSERLQDSSSVDRLVAEARLGFQLTHGNICQVLDLVLAETGAYLVLEYVDGLDLRELIKRRGGARSRIEPAPILYIGREIARALDYAHRTKDRDGQRVHVIHGDVTPQNILLSLEGEAKLADFGIARALGVTSPGADVVGGTEGFMAPELFGGAVDHRSDLYSLGATLHFALTGVTPRVPRDVRELQERGDLSPSFIDVIERSLGAYPEERFASAAELESALAFELARKYPAFTPSSLAQIIREARQSAGPAEPLAAGTRTLFSLSADGRTLSTGDETVVDVPWLAKAPEPHSELAAQLGPAEPAGAPSPRTVTVSTPASRRSRRWLLWLGVMVVAALAGGFGVWGLEERPGPAGAAPADAGPEGRQALVRPLEGGTSPTLADASAGARAQTAADARAIAVPGSGAPRRERRTEKKKEPPAEVARSSEPAFLSVNATPWGAVLIDGEVVAEETPAFQLRVPPGRHRVVVVFGDGTRSKPRLVKLRPGQKESIGFTR